MQDTVFSKTLEIKNNKLLRTIPNIDEIEKIIEVINKKGLFGKSVVNTKVFSKEKNIIEHEYLNYIIHSGEYTESMGYDVQKYSLELALDFIKEKIYGWDLLPHNFTYKNGTWFLYDFDSFSINPERIITQMRGFFKISFSNFEVQRLLTRSEMSYFYLTRMRIEDIIQLIPLNRWIYLYWNMFRCQRLLNKKKYKEVYKFLLELFEKYTKDYKKELYEYSLNKEEEILFERITKEVANSKNAFCVGETAAKWAIQHEQNNDETEKFAYIDDYLICDKYYNYIYKNGYKNLSTAVLYPLVDDENIEQTIKYRALYDSYAQFRFYSDCVISLDNNDIDALKNFTNNLLIVKSELDITEKLKEHFDCITKIENIFIAKNKKDKTRPTPNKPYEDGNRGPDAHRQTWELLKIIKQKYKN